MTSLNNTAPLGGDSLLMHEAPRLTQARSIRPPYSIELPEVAAMQADAEVLAAFSRSREIPIPWNDILHLEDTLAESDELARFKALFEASWDGHPLYHSANYAQFIEVAAAGTAERLLGSTAGDLVLYVPGAARTDARVEFESNRRVKHRGGKPFRFPVTTYTRTRRYLGPDPGITWRYYKLVPKQPAGAPLMLDFWKTDTYDASWKNIQDIVELKPTAVITDHKDDRGPGGSGVTAVSRTEEFVDAEAKAAIPALEAASARQVFEQCVQGHVRADQAMHPETTAPITLSAAAKEAFFFGAAAEQGKPVKTAVPDGTVLFRVGRANQVYRVIPLPHIAGSVDTLFKKLSGQKGPADYEMAWATDIASVERVYRDAEFEKLRTQARYLDLMAQYIRRHFWDIDARIELYAKLLELAKQIPAALDVQRSSPAEIDEAIERYRQISARKADNDFEMRKLSDAARALGYVLNTKEKGQDGALTVNIPKKGGGGTEAKPLLKGELYRAFINSVSWFEDTWVSGTQERLTLLNLARRLSPVPIPPLLSPSLSVASTAHVMTRSFGGLGGGLGKVISGGLGGLGKIISRTGIGGLVPGLPLFDPLGLLTSRRRSPPKAYRQQVITEYTDYEIENSPQSPVEELSARYRADGHTVFVFGLTAQGYVDEGGRTLSEIMAWCGLDERFRTSCVVLIPKHRMSLLDGPLVIGYHIIRAPRAGAAIVEPPKLMIEDRLSFVTKWMGTELGLPIDSINLAPGESRTINVSREYAAASRTASEVIEEFDVTESYSTSFTTEFERTVRHEQEKKNSSNWNAKASGSYMGIVEGGVSGGGSSEKTVKDFAEEVQKSAQKAASEVTRKTRNKITTSRSEESSIKTIDSTASTVSNINAGATLNLSFYQLNNVFASGVIADGIRIGVSNGVELIEGTGIVERRVFPVQEVDKALAMLVSAPAFSGHLKNSRAEVLSAALDSLSKVLHDDYYKVTGLIEVRPGSVVEKELQVAGTPEATPFARYASMVVRMKAAAAGVAPLDAVAGEEAMDGGGEASEVDELGWTRVLDAQLDTLRTTFDGWSSAPKMISHSLLRLPSSAVYVDSQLGEGRATEPYSDIMRHAEWEAKNAQTESVRAGAELQRAQAEALSNGRKMHGTGVYRLQQPKIQRVAPTTITLSGALPAGDWIVNTGGTEVVYLGASFQGKDTVTLTNFKITPEAEVSLVEMHSGIFIGS